MSHSIPHIGILAFTFWVSTAPSGASATEAVVEAEQVARRTVVVTSIDLDSDHGLDVLHRKLRGAAREVCNQQYNADAYLYERACYARSLRDSKDQLLRVKQKRLASHLSGDLHILVQAR